jgi:hypothetical protein
MRKVTFCRPPTCFPASTGNSSNVLQRICILSRKFATTSALRNTKRVHDTTEATGDLLDHTDAPSEYPSSKLRKGGSFDLDTLRTRFRQLSDRSAVTVRRQADDFTAKAASTFSQLGSQLNRVTGYEEIEALKRQVVDQGSYISRIDRFLSLT